MLGVQTVQSFDAKTKFKHSNKPECRATNWNVFGLFRFYTIIYLYTMCWSSFFVCRDGWRHGDMDSEKKYFVRKDSDRLSHTMSCHMGVSKNRGTMGYPKMDGF